MSNADLIVIGGGNMAGAIIEGVVDAGPTSATRIAICDILEERRTRFLSERFRGRIVAATATVTEAMAAGAPSAPVLLCVKPQVFPKIAPELGDSLGPPRLVASIMAGVSMATISRSLGAEMRLIRLMPNLPASLRLGVTAMAVGDSATREDVALIRMIFESCGSVVEMPEDLVDGFTGLAGSGPAYVFYLAEAMIRAGIEVGFDAETADAIVRQVIVGAAAMLSDSDASAAAMRRAVTSPKGTTAAAIERLDADKVMQSLIGAIEAARDRGHELAG